MNHITQVAEIKRCFESPAHFIERYIRIYDAVASAWIPFGLWAAQRTALDIIMTRREVVILKARQLGLSWLTLAFALWQMVFQPSAVITVFSRRETEATYLLGEERLRGMFKRLPAWLIHGLYTTTDNRTSWGLSNGSIAYAFPTTAGDSYTVTTAIVDEADLCPLDALLRAVKPTIDNGGRLLLVSRADKSKPASTFKRIYRAAVAGENSFAPLFLAWDAHPGRDAAWYTRQTADVMAATGSLDVLHEQYPATASEALEPATQDKRLPLAWLKACYAPSKPTALNTGAPMLPGFTVYTAPQAGVEYAIGADPAEGNPTSDDSAASVVTRATLQQVAILRGKFQPGEFADYLQQLSAWYNRAQLLVERNNHGHAVLALLAATPAQARVLNGTDKKPGWLTTANSKAFLYANDALRHGTCRIADQETYLQLASIEGSTLNAPEGEHDDAAMAYMLSLHAGTLSHGVLFG